VILQRGVLYFAPEALVERLLDLNEFAQTHIILVFYEPLYVMQVGQDLVALVLDDQQQFVDLDHLVVYREFAQHVL